MNGKKKVAINNKFGGFNISPTATRMIAERKGRKCYFYLSSAFCARLEGEKFKEKYIPVTEDDCAKEILWFAFDTPNANEDIGESFIGKDGSYSEYNAIYEKYRVHYGDDRADKDLIAVVEEIGIKAASGRCCEIKIVEIPDDVEYQIEEYDGNEWVAEKHRTWR